MGTQRSPVWPTSKGLKPREWQNKECVDRYTTEIVAESMQLLGGRQRMARGAGGEDDGGSQGDRSALRQRPAPASRPAAQAGAKSFQS